MEPSKAPAEPARLFRFVGASEIPGLLAHYDENNNLLRINKEMFDLLDPPEQKAVLRSRRSIEAVTLVPAEPSLEQGANANEAEHVGTPSGHLL